MKKFKKIIKKTLITSLLGLSVLSITPTSNAAAVVAFSTLIGCTGLGVGTQVAFNNYTYTMIGSSVCAFAGTGQILTRFMKFSHQVQNPLDGKLGFTALFLSEGEEPNLESSVSIECDEETMSEYAETIVATTMEADQSINDGDNPEGTLETLENNLNSVCNQNS